MEPKFRLLVTMRNWRGTLSSGGYANGLDKNPGIAEIVDVSDQYPLDEAHMCQVVAERGPFHACLVGDDTLSAAVLINPSRGGLLVEEDVVAAYQRQNIGGVAVDVLVREFAQAAAEPPPLLALLQHAAPIIITPHVGSLTEQTMPRQVDWMQRNVLACLGLIDGSVEMWLPEAAAPW